MKGLLLAGWGCLAHATLPRLPAEPHLFGADDDLRARIKAEVVLVVFVMLLRRVAYAHHLLVRVAARAVVAVVHGEQSY